MIRRITVATDFSAHSQQALRHAGALARLHGAEVELYSSCFLSPLALGSAPYSLAPAFFAHLERDAQSRLEQAAIPLRSEGIAVTCCVSADEPSSGILERARSGRSDLIVLGTRGLSGLAHVLLGSVAERVARMAPCPVFSAHADHPHPTRYGVLAVASDFSSASAAALSWARGFADKAGARVVLLHCVTIGGFGHREPVPADDDLSAHEELGQARLKLRALALPHETHEVVRGHLHTAGVEALGRLGAQLLVVGTRGRSGLPHILLGSNAERAMRRSPVPVVTVRDTEA